MARNEILLEQGHQRLVQARHGFVLFNKNDTVIGRSIETYGEYFESEVRVFRTFLQPGDVALDIGANIGTHTLAMARLVGTQGFVLAFEPQRLVFQVLCANMAINAISHVHCVNAALAEVPARLNIVDPDPDSPNNFGGASVSAISVPTPAASVEQIVLDEFLDVGRLKLVKIDVEGMEASVLRGGRKAISRLRPVLYVENAFADRSQELAAVLAELRYACYWHLPLFFARDNFFANPDEIFPVGVVDRGEEFLDCIGFAINLLCVPRGSGAVINGLRPFADPAEHPLKRDSCQWFTTSNGRAIPLLKG